MSRFEKDAVCYAVMFAILQKSSYCLALLTWCNGLLVPGCVVVGKENGRRVGMRIWERLTRGRVAYRPSVSASPCRWSDFVVGSMLRCASRR